MKGSKTLLFIFLMSFWGYADNDSLRLNSLENELAVYQSRLDRLLRTQDQVLKEARDLRMEMMLHESNRDSLNQQIAGQISENRSMMDDFSAKQVQTERALNLALDQFQQRFEQQNRVAAQLEAQLQGQVNYQLIIMVAAFATLIVLFILLNRSSIRKSLAHSNASWNQFQDHFLKNN